MTKKKSGYEGKRELTAQPKQRKSGASKASRLACYDIPGRHAVTAALANFDRICHELVCSAAVAAEPDGPVAMAKRRGVPVVVVDAAALDKRARGGVHQHMLLKVSPHEHDMPAFDGPHHTVMILDHVSDPQNVGAALRSCGAFGVDTLFVHDRGSPFESGAMAKAACGFLETVKYIAVKNIAELITKLQEQGFSVAALDAEGETTLHHMTFAPKQAFVMGSEGRGVRRLPLERADIKIRIPMTPDAEGLNVSVATGVCLYARFASSMP